MKKRMRRMAALALAGALIVGLSIPAAAFSFPSAYWPLQEAWSAAVSMARLTNNGLMSGKGNGILAPRSNTSVQEGITLILALNQNWI